ncbi:MAG: polyphosphate polymerase domain-containing protein [Lentimicrobiaceae bacterium]|jgi:hypothetical protein
MNELSATLSNFSPISLEEMDHVALLDRIDTKYVIHENQLREYLTAVASNYKLLVISGKTIHPYETLYFDTADFLLYHMHHNGKLNRYKLRYRKYVDSGISFFEIKSKINTSHTVKIRMQVDDILEKLDEPMYQYISEHTPGDQQNFVPALRVFFDRLTLVNKQANERLTFDLNLRYKFNGVEKKMRDIVIVEVKQEKYTISPFRELMKMYRLPSNYLSKYCIGLTSIHKELKMNNFKQKINTLSSLGYDLY